MRKKQIEKLVEKLIASHVEEMHGVVRVPVPMKIYMNWLKDKSTYHPMACYMDVPLITLLQDICDELGLCYEASSGSQKHIVKKEEPDSKRRAK